MPKLTRRKYHPSERIVSAVEQLLDRKARALRIPVIASVLGVTYVTAWQAVRYLLDRGVVRPTVVETHRVDRAITYRVGFKSH